MNETQHQMTCLIVDDEPIARKGIAEYVSQTGFLELVGSCESVKKASAALSARTVDLLYLDIHMPKVSGIEFLKSLRHPPLTILTTAYPDYALEGYALDVIDYLMKPVTFDRFFRATQKALEIHELRRAGKPGSEAAHAALPAYFFVKCDSRYEKIIFSDVLFIEAMQNYVIIHTANRKVITYLTLSGIEAQLPADQFMKVHKSFIVSLSAIQSIDGNEIVTGASRIPISRNLKDNVVARIVGKNLFRR